MKSKKADITMPARYSLPIHISPLLHADVMVFPDDDVVETSDADDVPCFDQSFGHFDVFPTWGRVPARMIVHSDKARRRQLERLTKHIAWVDDRGVEPTDEERLPSNQLILRIQIQTNILGINTKTIYLFSIFFIYS